MPELPEVETIVRGLIKEVLGKRIINVWTDWPRHFLRHKGGFKSFSCDIKGAEITNVSRIGKNIIFELSNGRNVLLHLKMTGRLLIFGLAKPEILNQPLRKSDFQNIDPYIHTIFYLSHNKILVFSDVRKFGKIFATLRKEFENHKDVKNIGQDALKIKYDDFKKALVKRKISIKHALLDQKYISGIGNIYADEILFVAGVHPLRSANKLTEAEVKKIYGAIKIILSKAIKLRGSSMSDYRDIHGKIGNYYNARLVYGRFGERCPKCKTKIKRLKLRGRSMHFCEKCQR